MAAVKTDTIKLLMLLSVAFINAQELPTDIREELLFSNNLSNRGSFDVVVTPIPIDPNAATFAPVRKQDTCTCIAYHECEPANSPTSTLDSRFTPFGAIDVRLDALDVCPEILDVCCRKTAEVQIPVTPPPIVNKTGITGCGVRNVGGLDFTLVGDFNNEAGFGEFPWTTALMQNSDSKYVCGASLIHPNVVLTANHCTKFVTQAGPSSINRQLQVESQPPSTFKVRAGEWDTQTMKERLPYQERMVSRIISHPEYSSKSLANDVALLVLERPFDPADHINVVCLPPANFVANSPDCFASGWGKSQFGSQAALSVILKKVPLAMVDYSTCQSQLRSTRLGVRFNLDQSFVCAGGVKGIDTCQGDGGAPLVCPVGPADEFRYAQVGSVAWGIGCHDDVPAVYSNVASFRTWIDSTMRGLGYNPSGYTY